MHRPAESERGDCDGGQTPALHAVRSLAVVVTTRRVIHHAPPPPPVHVTRIVRYGYGHYGHGSNVEGALIGGALGAIVGAVANDCH